MYRILLPDGELTLTSRVVPVHLEYDKELRYTSFHVVPVGLEPNALYIFLQESSTNHNRGTLSIKVPLLF